MVVVGLLGVVLAIDASVSFAPLSQPVATAAVTAAAASAARRLALTYEQ